MENKITEFFPWNNSNINNYFILCSNNKTINGNFIFNLILIKIIQQQQSQQQQTTNNNNNIPIYFITSFNIKYHLEYLLKKYVKEFYFLLYFLIYFTCFSFYLLLLFFISSPSLFHLLLL